MSISNAKPLRKAGCAAERRITASTVYSDRVGGSEQGGLVVLRSPYRDNNCSFGREENERCEVHTGVYE